MSYAKPLGTSIFFVNANSEILLLLRDNIPQMKFPNMWDLPGGNLENGETPTECITREIEEEFSIQIHNFKLFEVRDFPDRLEYTFWQFADFDIQKIKLTEGQRLAWFSEKKVKLTKLAFEFNVTVNSFFEKAPFKSRPI